MKLIVKGETQGTKQQEELIYLHFSQSDCPISLRNVLKPSTSHEREKNLIKIKNREIYFFIQYLIMHTRIS